MYLHELARGRETRPIEQALAEEPMYLNSSRYAWQLDQYLEFFDPDRICVLTSEALKADREATLARLFRFIGVDDREVPASIGEERGRTETKRTRRAVWRHLRGNRLYRAVVDRTPVAVRRAGERLLTRPVDLDAGVLPAGRAAELRASFHDDVARLKPFVGPDFDGWGIA
jgi:hypothetical protein